MHTKSTVESRPEARGALDCRTDARGKKRDHLLRDPEQLEERVPGFRLLLLPSLQQMFPQPPLPDGISILLVSRVTTPPCQVL